MASARNASASAASTGSVGYELPLPDFYNRKGVADMFRYVPYEEREAQAYAARKKFDITLAATDKFRVLVVPIDVQLTFCDPKGQLYVAGRSGTGAVDDTATLCEWGYRNGRVITKYKPSMDTHKRATVFHAASWIDAQGRHPSPATMIQFDDVASGKWQFNPEVAYSIGGNANTIPYLQAYFVHYVGTLTKQGKYALMIWPYHAMLGGIEHALVPAAHEMMFYHNCLRETETGHEIKGGNPLFENYAITHGEVLADQNGKAIGNRNTRFLQDLYTYDMVVIWGQAASHCVAWSVDGILEDIKARDPKLAEKVYLVKDGSSAVVIPGVIDFTDQADAAYARFASEGMHVVHSTTPIKDWGGVAAQIAA
jgi:nicotinamidase-related amidase